MDETEFIQLVDEIQSAAFFEIGEAGYGYKGG
jgi:hypothetical protein